MSKAYVVEWHWSSLFIHAEASMHCLVLFEVEGLPINRIVDHFYNRECIDSS